MRAFFSKVWGFCKKYWKAGLAIVVGLFVTLLGFWTWRKVQVILGKVTKKQEKVDWMKVEGRDDALLLQVPGKPGVREVYLPQDVKAESVKAVGYDSDKQIVTVEVLHEKVDRRNTTPRPDSALDKLAGHN